VRRRGGPILTDDLIRLQAEADARLCQRVAARDALASPQVFSPRPLRWWERAWVRALEVLGW